MRFLKKLRIQDYLSLFRIPAALVLIILAVFGFNTAFGFLFVFAVITDALDGYLARKKKQSNKRGSRLDSAGDATLFLAAITGVVILETEFFKDHIIPASVPLGLYFFTAGPGILEIRKAQQFSYLCSKDICSCAEHFSCLHCFFWTLGVALLYGDARQYC